MREKNNFSRLIAVGTAAVMLSLCSCGKSENSNTASEVHSRDVFAMDTYMSLKAYGDNAETALDQAVKRIYELEAELSVTDENSDISRINKSGGVSAEVSSDTISILSAALEYGAETNGSLDITMYPVLREWGFTTQDYKIPEPTVLADLLKKVDYTQIEISSDSVTVPEDVMIDVGALAKGYTSDAVIEIMAENNVDSAIISLGGNVQALGHKPDGSCWKVAVVDPFQPDTDMCIIETDGKAVITSGNYERFFIGEDGKKYWHIMDPADGCPADNGLVSVTVIGESGLTCDSLSTALFVAGKDKATEYWRSHRDIDLILVTDNGSIYYTEGIADAFQNISGMPAEVITVD